MRHLDIQRPAQSAGVRGRHMRCTATASCEVSAARFEISTANNPPEHTLPIYYGSPRKVGSQIVDDDSWTNGILVSFPPQFTSHFRTQKKRSLSPNRPRSFSKPRFRLMDSENLGDHQNRRTSGTVAPTRNATSLNIPWRWVERRYDT